MKNKINIITQDENRELLKFVSSRECNLFWRTIIKLISRILGMCVWNGTSINNWWPQCGGWRAKRVLANLRFTLTANFRSSRYKIWWHNLRIEDVKAIKFYHRIHISYYVECLCLKSVFIWRTILGSCCMVEPKPKLVVWRIMFNENFSRIFASIGTLDPWVCRKWPYFFKYIFHKTIQFIYVYSHLFTYYFFK